MMSHKIIEQIALKLQVEDGFSLLAKVDDSKLSLPDEEVWESKFNQITDEIEKEKLLKKYEEKIIELQKSWEPVTPDAYIHRSLTAFPPLYEATKEYDSVLVKIALKRATIVLIQSEDKNNLKESELVKLAKELNFDGNIVIQSIYIGKNRKALDEKTKTTKFINTEINVVSQAFWIDLKQKKVGASSMLTDRERLKLLKRVIREGINTPKKAIQYYNSHDRSYIRIITSALGAYLAQYIAVIITVFFAPEDIKGYAITFIKTFAPFIVIALFSTSSINRSRQLSNMLIALGVYTALDLSYYVFTFGLSEFHFHYFFTLAKVIVINVGLMNYMNVFYIANSVSLNE
jgi:hypothetical protein